MQKGDVSCRGTLKTAFSVCAAACIVLSVLIGSAGCSRSSTAQEDTKPLAGPVISTDESQTAETGVLEPDTTDNNDSTDINDTSGNNDTSPESSFQETSSLAEPSFTNEASSQTDTASSSNADVTHSTEKPSDEAASSSVADTKNDTDAAPEDRDELIDTLKKAIKLTESLETYHVHTVTTITDATSTGETSSVTELGVHVVADDDEPALLATGSVRAFERSYPVEFYYKDGIIYQNIAGVKSSKKSNIDSAIRSVSGSLWYPAKDSIDTISKYDAGNNMTRYLINIITEDPSSRAYVETFVKADGYVDSQHYVNQTITGDKAGSSSDKWVSFTFVEGDFMPVFPDFSEYDME